MADSDPARRDQSGHESKFLDLSVEIRLLIYAELLARPEPIHFLYVNRDGLKVKSSYADTTFRARHTRLTKSIFPAILETCKQVYSEAMPVLYMSNAFKYEPEAYGYGNPHWIHNVLRCVGYEHAKFSKRLVISMWKYLEFNENNMARATWRD
jgi:hypothetical protein